MNESLSADYLMSFITLPNVLGATGALFYVISMSMKTVIPLRITSIVSAACLLGSSVLARSLPAILLYALLLPVHSFRLYQMLELIKKVHGVNAGLRSRRADVNLLASGRLLPSLTARPSSSCLRFFPTM